MAPPAPRRRRPPLLPLALGAILSGRLRGCARGLSVAPSTSTIAGTRRGAAPRGRPPPPLAVGPGSLFRHHRPPRRASLLLSAFSSSDDDDDRDRDRTTPRDVLVIGGGLAGLSAAHRIATTSARHVTLLEREVPDAQRERTTAGSFAAAGMLAPQSERLPAGPLLDICLRSREMYGGWIARVERGAREASLGVAPKRGRRGRRGGDAYTGEGAKYLWELTDDDGVLSSFDGGPDPPLEPWETGFHSTGGFLAPAFAGDAVATWSPQPDSGKAYWLDDVQVRELEPRLHPDVVGGWWFPEDASVDARRLTCALRAACVGAGVQMNFGPEWEVTSLEMSGGTCRGVHLANGKVFRPDSVVVANGSWMRHLLPLPVTPHKGQSFSLRMPTDRPPILSRVLFAQDTYIVPKADGRIIVGATVEPGRYDGDVTPSGMLHCLSEATRLVPSLGELPIEESWAGLRPTTPDKCPILGRTEQWDNVYLAGGYWRNGVLLAPKTGQLIGDLIVDGEDGMSEEDRALLKAFSWERFTAPGGGKALAANARYAATFYPVHKRSTDGVATSVGTELGFYEGAAAARGDREKDRRAMFGMSEEEEEALERAAGMGVGDARAFSFGDEGDGWKVRRKDSREDDEVGEDAVAFGETVAVDADPDAFTVGAAEDSHEMEEKAEEASESLTQDLPSIYEMIKANKAKAAESIVMGDSPAEERPDPGFRIYHKDPASGDVTEVPPFTSPSEFFQMKAEGKLSVMPSEYGEPSGATEASSGTDTTDGPTRIDKEGEEETVTFDGYTAIREAYGEKATAEETAKATREARTSNRIKSSEIDESKIGVINPDKRPPPPPPARVAAKSSSPSSDAQSATGDLSAIYAKIRANKAAASQDIEMGVAGDDERPKLNFTIYHVDATTREVREVPPYTSPGEFLASIEEEKAARVRETVVVNGDRGPPANIPPTANGNIVEKEEPSLDVDADLVDDGSDEKTYDGYQEIQSANSSASREDELRRMREARIANRAKASGIMGESLDGIGDVPRAKKATGVGKPNAAAKAAAGEDEKKVGADVVDDGSDEKTYDGYQAIQSANSSESREEELRRMREARIANRAKASGIMGGSID